MVNQEGRSTRAASSRALQALPALFAAQAARTPDAPAVRSEGVTWSYAELGRRVNRLARYLAQRGVGKGALVPLFLRPVPEALQAMLAVMQAGAAYVPLDPAYASDRMQVALEEIQPPLLLSLRRSAEGRRTAFPGEVVHLDELDLSGFEPAPLRTRVGAKDLAYVIYTSGTTGRPNGVEVSHGALANYLAWCVRHYPLADNPGGSLVFTSIGFDLTVTSLFVPLLVGQPAHFVKSDANDLAALADALRRASERFSLLKMTPSHLRGLWHLLSPQAIAEAAGCLVLGGEQLYARDLAGLEPYLGGRVRVFNEYGPTEAVVGATCHEVARLPEDGAIPIGAPIDNVRVHVCDERLKPVPPGTAGELCIAGHGLARGYFKRDELTAGRFVRLAGAKRERAYRTGDLGRLGDDGALEFLGRQDTQVKLRGHRIELEEIEVTLRGHAAVDEAVVLLDAEQEPARLIAFVVPNVSRREVRSSSGRIIRYAVAPSELRTFLSTRVPNYMLPSLFVLLDAVPRNAHGKMDRAAMLRLAASGAHAQAEYVTPRNETEEALAAVVSKVLKVEPVGIDDNYFALGGDSIRSIQIAGEAQARGLQVSVGDLHRFTTIRRLAEHLADRDRKFVEMPRTQPFDLVSADDRARIPADVEDAYPLNLLQEGMIYHRAFAAKSAVYHAMLCLPLQAPFDLEALRRVVQELVNRHPLLRTSFDQKTFSIPLQLVHRTFRDPLQFVDLQGLTRQEQQARIDTWIEEEKRRGFDVDEFPLIRFMVHRLGEDTFQLSFSYHHEIIDGWSESTMVSELLTHYLSIVNGEPVEITAPQASFRDSVLLEQMALKSEEFRGFWERSLEGASFMRLPRLLTGPKADKGERSIVKLHFPFSKESSDRLKRLALTLGVPLKSVLLAGHMKVMGLFGGSHDVLTHTVSNGRPESPDGIGLIGLFVNSFTFRQRLAHTSWRGLVLDTLKLEQASIPYRRYPMAELKRHQGRDPLSETLFFMIDYHVYHRLERWNNAKLLDYHVYGESTFPFCATFRINHFTSELDMQIEYDSLQFPRELVDSISEAYFDVYRAMVTDPGAKHHLFTLRGTERATSLSGAAEPPRACMHEWIEEQARRTPDAVAIVTGDASVSYAGLNARANRLARWLRQRGVGSECEVALLLERGADLVAALLAVLKAGGAYVPLDPEHRSERTAAILGQVRPTVVLTREALRGLLPQGTAAVSVEQAWSEAAALDAADLAAPVAPQSAAYVIFTSGSTGAPKGVAVPHASLVQSTAARLSVYPAPPERFLLLSSPAFDSSVAGLYWTLCTGGTLILPEGSSPLDLNLALNLARREGVTHTLCIPSFYASMLESQKDGDLGSLDTVVVAGEECRSELWDQHQRRAPGVAFYNEYGPTEATVWATVWKGDPGVKRASLPIGRPLPRVTGFVLDSDGYETPTGVAGELYLGGAQLARGYVRNPAATAERFVPNPFAGPGQRLYRSGDLTRLTLAGEIEYLGRIDHQIKIRGFRIEPAEIEACLETHPRVKRAVVVPREDASGERVLVAFVVTVAQGELSAPELLAYVKDKLPKYLVPSSIMILEALPLTATGKVDRNALPSYGGESAAEKVAPRTPTEQAIAGMWTRVLGVEHVGVFDDFFALGGESLRAMRILSQIRKAFEVELPITSLVQSQATVAALAEEVDAALWLRANPATVAEGAGLEDRVI